MNCFPVLIGIVSNALLGIFNVTELIKTESSTFPLVSRGVTSVRGSSAGRKGQGRWSLCLSLQPAPCKPSCFLGLSCKRGMLSDLLYIKLWGLSEFIRRLQQSLARTVFIILQVFLEYLPWPGASRCWRYSICGTGGEKNPTLGSYIFVRGRVSFQYILAIILQDKSFSPHLMFSFITIF